MSEGPGLLPKAQSQNFDPGTGDSLAFVLDLLLSILYPHGTWVKIGTPISWFPSTPTGDF